MKKESNYSNFRDEPDIHLDDDDDDHFFQNDKVWGSEIKTQFSEMKTRIASEKYKQKKVKGKKDQKDMKRELTMDEHIIPLEELCKRLEVDPERGLSQAEAQKRIQMYGPNVLTPPKPKSKLAIFAGFCLAPFSLLLWFASGLCWIAFGLDTSNKDSLLLAVVLIAVILVTATFAYAQTASSLKVMEGFSKLVPLQAVVVRDGEKIPIEVSQLTMGDIVEVKGGDKVPADIRIIQASALKVDNSSLTGESEPQPRGVEMTEENPLETRNLAFYSTSINQGSGRGIVVKTGNNTVIGRIASLATTTTNTETPINREMTRFVHIVMVVACINSIIFFVAGFFSYPIKTNIVFVVGILVASVPEGVLISVSVCLTLAAKKMASKNVLVKNLESVETLGSTSTICSDKTGTLTMNQMTVQHLWVNGTIFRADKGVHGEEPVVDLNNPVCKQLTNVAALCNIAYFTDEFKKETSGDASETALLKYCNNILDIDKWRNENPRFVLIPFNSVNKFAVSVNKGHGGQHYVLLKGAPERVLARCTKIHMYNQEKNITEELPLTEEWKRHFQVAYETLGGKGERVLGFCHARLDSNKYNDEYPYSADDENWQMQDLTFSGLISMIDPPRPAVPDAVRKCQEAGIRVVMVTGDHPITAKAIAKQVGIISQDTKEDVAKRMGIHVNQVDPSSVSAIVVSGGELMDMTDEEVDEVIANHTQIVFARTSPQQKLLIVEGFQRKGDVVAVTGDGVNDSPALKKADIGIAMGITGSDVSKEAADMILLDDNFASIVKGIEEGRVIFDNLKKTVAYLLTAGVPQIVPYYLYVFAKIPLPITTILTLCIAVGTDLLPAISLSYEKAETDIMKRRPRDPIVDKLVTIRLLSFSYLQAGIIQAISGIFTYFVVMGDFGVQPKSLPGLGFFWKTEDKVMMFKDKNGRLYERDYKYRENAISHAQTATFVAVVVNQWGTLLMCKTRKLSLFQQGMWNWVLNFGLLEETLLFIALCYIPFLHPIFLTRALAFQHIITGVPFTFLMVLYDECRKFLIRRNKTRVGHFVEEYSYY